MMMIVRTNK